MQQQIDELTAHVNRLRTLIEEPNDKSYFAGLASVSQFRDCIKADGDRDCKQKELILIDVLEGQPIKLEINAGQPWPTELYIIKVPSENPLSSRDYRVNVVADNYTDTFPFNVSPDHPFYASNYDSNYPGTMLSIKCELVTDWRIKIITVADYVRQIRTESFGAIDNAYSELYSHRSGLRPIH